MKRLWRKPAVLGRLNLASRQNDQLTVLIKTEFIASRLQKMSTIAALVGYLIQAIEKVAVATQKVNCHKGVRLPIPSWTPCLS